MKNKKILMLIGASLFLVSCGSKNKKNQFKPINFKEMTAAEARDFFDLKDGKVMNETLEMGMPISENVTEYVQMKAQLARKGNTYKELYGQDIYVALSKENIVDAINELAGADVATQENYLDTLGALCESIEGTLEEKEDMYVVNFGAKFDDPEYYVVLPNEVYGLYYRLIDESYYKVKEFNLDPYDNSMLGDICEIKDYISYDTADKTYKFDTEELAKEDIEMTTFTKAVVSVDKNNQFTGLEISGVNDEGAIITTSIEISDFNEEITLPSVEECEHEINIYNMNIEKSNVDNEYYHYTYCFNCYSDENIEKCNLVDGVCTECGLQPQDDEEVYVVREEEGKKEFVIDVWYNEVTNKITSVYCYSGTLKYDDVDYEDCTFSSLTIDPTEIVDYVNLYDGKEKDYVAVATHTEEGVSKYYFLVEATIVEDGGHYEISGGRVISYTLGELFK